MALGLLDVVANLILSAIILSMPIWKTGIRIDAVYWMVLGSAGCGCLSLAAFVIGILVMLLSK